MLGRGSLTTRRSRHGRHVCLPGELLPGVEESCLGVGPDPGQAAPLRVGEGGVGPVGVRVTAPQPEGGGQEPHGVGRLPGREPRATSADEVGEPQRIDVRASHGQGQAGPAAEDVLPARPVRKAGFQGAPEAPERGLQRVPVPERLGQPVGGDHPGSSCRQDPQEQALLPARQCDRGGIVRPDLQRSEDRDLHAPTVGRRRHR